MLKTEKGHGDLRIEEEEEEKEEEEEEEESIHQSKCTHI
jgi:hypothetical protein